MSYLSKYLFFITFILLSCSSNEVFFENALCIENIHTINPIDGLKKNQTVIIQRGKIIKISPSRNINLSQKNTIINGTDKYLIPGLWDTHVHYAYIEELAPLMSNLFLKYGVTSVRDTGGKIDIVKKWKDRALDNPLEAPRILMAGPLLDGIPTVYDGSDTRLPELAVGLNSIEAITKQIDFLESQKVDFLKAYEMLSPQQFHHILKIANEKGLKVTGHIPLSMDVISASNAGLHSIEHMRNLDLSCASNSDELLQERRKMLANNANISGGRLRSKIHKMQQEKAIDNYDETKADSILSVLKRNDTWQIPTLALNTFYTRRYFERPEWQESYSVLPDSIQHHWLSRAEALTEKVPSEFRKKYDIWHIKMVKKIHDANIPIMAGTDTPIAYLTPGLSLHEELASLVDAGLTPLEALKTATTNPAKYFNLEKELGKIKEGMWADLLILNDNPLVNIKNTTKINTVIKQGKVHLKN
ncbi:amidohydrolase family protein [uncultured Maribacter sp.]|uniref:amidohydrolase family protein n=1 Tax=uncultured Maribacter sp. TaxID=431308 RepID=UPI00261555CF|nr:amidohydrolase family protein [uncultured Maribacter sp.]